MKETRNVRLVNIELLRILAMFGVLLAHYIVPVWGNVTHEGLLSSPAAAVFQTAVQSLFSPCVDVFIVISGYFGIRWKWNGLLKLLFQIFFWMAIIPFIAYAFGVVDTIQPANYVKGLLLCFQANWFFLCYLVLYAISPILNSFLDNTPEKRILATILAFYFVQTLFGYVLKVSSEFSSGMSSMSFIGLYLLGGYLRRTTHPWFHMSLWGNAKAFLLSVFVLFALSLGGKYVNFSKEVYSYINPITIVQSVFVFLMFRKLEISRCGKVITFFSTSVFAVLLAHTREGAQLYDHAHKWIAENLPYPLIAGVVFMILFFTAAVFIDQIRIFIWNRLSALSNRRA